jgi:hypothetical protein
MKNWFMAGNNPKDYEIGIDTNMAYNGKNSGYIKAKSAEPGGFGTMMQMFKATDYLNKRMSFSAYVKSERIEAWAGLWMRIDGPDQQRSLGFDNMQNRPIKGTTDWQKYQIVLDVPPESADIAFGILLEGKGQAWLSEVQFEGVGVDVPTTSSIGDKKLPDKPENLDFAE